MSLLAIALMKIVFYSLLLCFFIPCSYGQAVLSSQHKKAIAAYEGGLKALQDRNIEQAFSEFEEAIEKDKLFSEAYFQLGRLYEQNRQFANAILNYEKAVNSHDSSSVSSVASQQVGLLYLRKGDYDKATAYLEKGVSAVSPSNRKRYAARLASAKFGQEAILKPLAINAVELPKEINQFDSQYFPCLTADQETLIFTGKSPENRDENLYVSTWNSGQWTSPTSLSNAINTPQNEGTASISADGNTLVFTSCNNRNGFGSCDLYISYKTGNDWSAPKNLGNTINSPEWESQPSLSADGSQLYFVSDRRGSLGKRDIWTSKLDSLGNWQKAVNVGTSINTTEDDLSPFIHANGKTLFYASEGLVGMGGLDIYFSNFENNKWTNPQNLGYPINTAEDQVALFITADGKKAYYSLEQEQNNKTRKAKLMVFDVPSSLQNQFKSANYLKGFVVDAKTQRPLEAEIELVSLSSQQAVGKFRSDKISGRYATVLTSGGEYAVFVNKQGYFFKSLHLDYATEKNQDKVLNIALEPIQKNTKEVLNNIFFATGKWEISTSSFVELDKVAQLLKANPSLPVEISGHTDDVGNDLANLQLSQKRAKAVVDYLIKQGVFAQQLKAEGYGKNKPVAPNTSDENRQLNRRIEIKFL
jgi:outer membrane protein OmpA-like peptidoglycan-associated protein/Tol biopolymer transport system component/predicted negative regulator of RcsB-dependent stress response